MTTDEFMQCWEAACKSPKSEFKTDVMYGGTNGTNGTGVKDRWYQQWHSVKVGGISLTITEDPYRVRGEVNSGRGDGPDAPYTAMTNGYTKELLTCDQVAICLAMWKHGMNWGDRASDVLERIRIA
jgi:hypothetical protein